MGHLGGGSEHDLSDGKLNDCIVVCRIDLYTRIQDQVAVGFGGTSIAFANFNFPEAIALVQLESCREIQRNSCFEERFGFFFRTRNEQQSDTKP